MHRIRTNEVKPMKNYILETCVDCVESAIAAQEGGADRVELCSDLVIGGVSPSVPLFRQIRKYTDLKIRTLLRPRYGDYCFSSYECDELNEEIAIFREEGADGVVVGILNPDGTLNTGQLARFKETAGDMEIALHGGHSLGRTRTAQRTAGKEPGPDRDPGSQRDQPGRDPEARALYRHLFLSHVRKNRNRKRHDIPQVRHRSGAFRRERL